MPINTSVGLPYSSALIKLETLPRKIPTGAEAQIKSVRVKKLKFLFIHQTLSSYRSLESSF